MCVCSNRVCPGRWRASRCAGVERNAHLIAQRLTVRRARAVQGGDDLHGPGRKHVNTSVCGWQQQLVSQTGVLADAPAGRPPPSARRRSCEATHPKTASARCVRTQVTSPARPHGDPRGRTLCSDFRRGRWPGGRALSAAITSSAQAQPCRKRRKARTRALHVL